MGLMHIDQLDTLYRHSIGLEIHLPITWGHRGQQGHVNAKMLFLLQITSYGHGTHAY